MKGDEVVEIGEKKAHVLLLGNARQRNFKLLDYGSRKIALPALKICCNNGLLHAA